MFHLTDIGRNELSKTKVGAYCLTRYRKPLVDPTLGTFRSVISKNGEVLCLAPPKSVPLDEFRAKHDFQNVRVEVFVDGTMINAFYDVGANNKFYERTFADLLADVELPDMDTSLSYSFVLQHQGCRNVVPVGAPTLVLVSSYRIQNGVAEETRYLPQIHASSYDELCSRAESLPWTAKGFMLLCGNDRSKVMSPAFLRASEVKGNDSQFWYRYLQLAQQNLVAEYLNYFPERRYDCHEMKHTVDAFIRELYRQLRVQKNPYAFVPHVVALRRYRDACLRPLPLSATDVEAYVRALPPAKLMYALNNIGR
jgi:hypothetical protein